MKRELKSKGNILSITGDVQTSVRSYLSAQFLWTARHLADLAGEIEQVKLNEGIRFDIQHRAYVISSINASVTFLEALINEIFQDVFDDFPAQYIAPISSQTRALMRAFWQVTENDKGMFIRPLEKYQISLQFANLNKFSIGRNPYQDAQLLINLRNTLTHFKPKLQPSKDGLYGGLRGKFELNTLMKDTGNPFFPDKCLGVGCARWGVSVVANFADEYCGRLGIRPGYQNAKF